MKYDSWCGTSAPDQIALDGSNYLFVPEVRPQVIALIAKLQSNNFMHDVDGRWKDSMREREKHGRGRGIKTDDKWYLIQARLKRTSKVIWQFHSHHRNTSFLLPQINQHAV